MSSGLEDIKVDVNNLYREENYSDLKVASLKHMVPIKADGTPDTSREAIFIAQTHIMSGMGPVPVSAKLKARNIAEAVSEFPAAVQEAVNELIDEAREMQRRESNKIVIPDAGSASRIITQ